MALKPLINAMFMLKEK